MNLEGTGTPAVSCPLNQQSFSSRMAQRLQNRPLPRTLRARTSAPSLGSGGVQSPLMRGSTGLGVTKRLSKKSGSSLVKAFVPEDSSPKSLGTRASYTALPAVSRSGHADCLTRELSMKEEQVPMALQSPAPSSLTGVRTISFLTPSQQEEHDSRERAISSGWRVTAKIIPNSTESPRSDRAIEYTFRCQSALPNAVGYKVGVGLDHEQLKSFMADRGSDKWDFLWVWELVKPILQDALKGQTDIPHDVVLGLAAMAQAAKVTLVPKITETHDAHNAAA